MTVTPEQVLDFKAPTKGFLCPLSANTYGIDFLSFQIRDYDSKRVIFEVSKENQAAVMSNAVTAADLSEESYRKIRYNFSVDVLRTPTISTVLTFGVGDNEVEDFRMIERHYFRDQLVKSYDFTFGFCIPNSTNTWEAVYAVPLLEDSLVEEMVANPNETRSDSFYFVDGKLVMHNKAEYTYSMRDAAESKIPTGATGRGAAKNVARPAAAGMKYAAKMASGGARASRSPVAFPAEAKVTAGGSKSAQ